jgi:NHL repeat.
LAVESALAEPTGIELDDHDRLFIADTGNHRVCAVDANGILTVVAGTGRPGHSGDGGSAIEALLSSPRGVAVSSDGVLYIADTGNGRLRAVLPDGRIESVSIRVAERRKSVRKSVYVA